MVPLEHLDRMTDSYLTLFLNSALAKNGDFLAPLSLLFLFLARFLPIIGLSPFFGARVMPNPVKVGFAIAMYVIFLPQLLKVTLSPINFNMQLILLFFKEMFVGFIIGFIMNVPFVIVQTAGMVIDHQRGASSLMVNDPVVQNQASPLSILFNFILIYLFYLIDGPFQFIDAISSSYEMIPPDRFFNTSFFQGGTSFWTMQLKLFQDVMKFSLQLAAPALIAILMTDVFLGIANRLAPQVQITFLGMPLKSLLGLAVICLGWQLLSIEMIKQCRYWIRIVVEAIALFKVT